LERSWSGARDSQITTGYLTTEETAMNGNGTTTIHADEAARMANAATDAAGKADQDTAAAAAAAAASAHAAAATANKTANGSSADRKAAKKARAAKAANTVSPKTWATTVAGAIAFSFWTIAAATFWKNAFSSETLAALTASTTTIVAAAAAYLKRDQLRAKK
jgi:hypothetical protein